MKPAPATELSALAAVPFGPNPYVNPWIIALGSDVIEGSIIPVPSLIHPVVNPKAVVNPKTIPAIAMKGII